MIPLLLLAMWSPVSMADDDVAKFQGTWKYESMEAAGKAIDVAPFKELLLVLKDNNFTQGEAKGTFTLDASKTPKTIDMTFSNGPMKGRTLKCLYELDDTTYKLCSGKPNGDRPKAFDSKGKDGGTISVLKKVKP